MRLNKTMKVIIVVAVAIVVALVVSAALDKEGKAGALIPNEQVAPSAGFAFNPDLCEAEEYPSTKGMASAHIVCANGSSNWVLVPAGTFDNLKV